MKTGRAIAALLLLLVSAAGAQEAAARDSNKATGRIVAVIAGIKSVEGGDLIISLYDSKEKWLKIEDARMTEIVKADADSATVTFEDLPYDSVYAVAVIHDKNLNGKLDMRRFPWPSLKEGAGVSNNEFGFGPPDYEDAVLRLDKPMLEIRIYMRY
jgi:uncharacterized protein (DUF2141 family)